MTQERITESIRRDWDERARKDAFFYIASWRSDWNAESFFRSGEDDYARLVTPVLDTAGFETAEKTVVEVGCGAGRMTRCFASRFGRVTAVDVSPEMQERAKRYLADFQNIDWLLAGGTDLSGIGSASSDLVFSYLVLQHFPSSGMAHCLMKEFSRILRPGGVLLFQFNGQPNRSMNLYGRVVWSFVDALWSIGLKKAARAVAKLLKLDPEMVGGSWNGVSLSVAEVRTTLEAAGISGLKFWGDGTQMAWCSGEKNAEAKA